MLVGAGLQPEVNVLGHVANQHVGHAYIMQASVALGNVPSTWTCPLRTLRVDRRRPIGSCLACPRASSGTTSNRTERQGWSAEDSPTSTSGVWSAWSGGDELTQPAHVSFQALDRAGHTVGVLGGQPGRHPATDPARTQHGPARTWAHRACGQQPRSVRPARAPTGRMCDARVVTSGAARRPADGSAGLCTSGSGRFRQGRLPIRRIKDLHAPEPGPNLTEVVSARDVQRYRPWPTGRGTGIARPGGQASRDRSITVALP